MSSFHDLPDECFDPFKVKTNPPNHLATRLEQQSAAGAKLPKLLKSQIAQRQQTTELIKDALQGLLPPELLSMCQVVFMTENRLTLAVPSITAVNHLRYVEADCLKALERHPSLCHYRQIRLMVLPERTHTQSQNNSKKPLSENTRHTIAQYANTVISHEPLRQSLLKLAQSVPTSD